MLSSDGSVLTERRERIGELWEWWPEARQVSDNSLEPGERRAYRLSYTVPDDLADLRVSVIVTNHRMTEANAEAMGILGRIHSPGRPFASTICSHKMRQSDSPDNHDSPGGDAVGAIAV